MAKNQYIAWILILLMVVTNFHLFYKPWVQKQTPRYMSLDAWSFGHPVSTSLCPLYGFKCPTDKPCNCAEYCKGGEAYVPYHILETDTMFMSDRQLPPGTYCLPKGAGTCNQETSYPVFSLSGWTCIPRNASIFDDNLLSACHNDEARDNTLNVLWDSVTNQPAADTKNIYNFYEHQTNGFRYHCKCGSKDVQGKPLFEMIPFTCAPDFCVRDIPNPPASIGWRKDHCECGPYDHKDPLDLSSPCVLERTRIELSGKLVARVDCMTNFAVEKKAMYCPKDEGALSFTNYVDYGPTSIEYLDRHKDQVERVEAVP